MSGPHPSARNTSSPTPLRVAGPRDALVAYLRDVCRQWLEAHLRAMLQKLDDKLFEKAVNAPIGTAQDGYFDAMRELRSAGGDFIRAFATDCTERVGGLIRAVPEKVDPRRGNPARPSASAHGKAFRAMAERSAQQHREVLEGVYELLHGLAGGHGLERDAFVASWAAQMCASCEHAIGDLKLVPGVLPVIAGAFEDTVLHELDDLCARLSGIVIGTGVTPLCADGRSDALAASPIEASSRPVVRHDVGSLLRTTAELEQLVDRLFANLDENDAVVRPVREQIARLRPLAAQMARRDHTLLSDNRHALAGLVNEIGELAFGRQESDARGDWLSERVAATVEALLSASAQLQEALGEQLAQWRTLALGERADAQRMQRSTEAAERSALVSAAAARAADATLAPCLESRGVPSAAKELLREGWRRVLLAAWLQGGRESQAWQMALVDLRAFTQLWSSVVYALPESLAERMREQMSHAGLDPLRVEVLLSGVIEAFSGWEPISLDESVVTGIAPHADDERADALLADSQMLQLAANLAPGSWIRFINHGDIRYGRFACHVGAERALLFVDREGRRLACHAPIQFAAMLQSGGASVVARHAWFDSALDAALDRLRGERHHVA
jgi:Protein of unknown function (DUF1631)